jgi:hypothetical protein
MPRPISAAILVLAARPEVLQHQRSLSGPRHPWPPTASKAAIFASIAFMFLGLALPVGAQSLSPADRARQTMKTMDAIAMAWEAFAVDHNSYAPIEDVPRLALDRRPGTRAAKTQFDWSSFVSLGPEVLRSYLEPTYIRKLPTIDGWGNPLQFGVHVAPQPRSTPDNEAGALVVWDYAIRSLGSDGLPDSVVYEMGPRDSFAADIIFGAGTFHVFPAGISIADAPGPTGKEAAHTFLNLLEESGYRYSKLADNVWTVDQDDGGRIVIAQIQGMVALSCFVVERERVQGQAHILTRLLEMNDEYDGAKVALNGQWIYVRLDTHVGVLDVELLRYSVNQVSEVTKGIVNYLASLPAFGKQER